ncbi:MAG: DNA internalization-related competence protein ComEC/Rec2, partial [Woeseia sp.]
MLRICLPSLAGAASLSLLAQLPPTDGALLAAGIGLGLVASRCTRPLGAWLLGLLLMWSAASQQMADQLPSEQDGNTFKFIAEVIEFPREDWPQVRLLVAPRGASDLPQRLRLSYFEPDRVPQAGEYWVLTARLRSPRGNRNPGSFDYAGWLHREGIGASGYVLTAELLEPRSPAFVLAVRQHLVQRLSRLLPEDDASATLLAISVGVRHRVSRAAWERYAATGTSHLMAISGLHIGLAAAGSGVLAWLLSAVCRPRGNSRDTATVFALFAAIAYAAISGFAVPAQRACLMLGMVAACMLRRQVLSAQELLGAVALVLFIAEPLVILTPGYLLSFMAVAVLLLLAREQPAVVATGVLARTGRWLAALLQMQGMLLLGLFPLTTLLFERLAWLAPAANLLVLPVFTLVTVPMALFGLLLDGPFAAAGDLMLWLAYRSLQLINHLLLCLAAMPGAGYRLATPVGMSLFVVWLPSLWVLLPRGMPGRGLAWVALAYVVVSRPSPPPLGCIDLYALDVGQGLANVVRTQDRDPACHAATAPTTTATTQRITTCRPELPVG